MNNAYNDAGVTDAAKAAGKPIHYEMGDATSALAYFAGMDAAAELQFLRWVTHDIEDGAGAWRRRAAVWEAGDLRSTEAFVEEMRRGYPDLYATHVVGRNRAWVPVCTKLLAGSGTTMIIVGRATAWGPTACSVNFPRPE